MKISFPDGEKNILFENITDIEDFKRKINECGLDIAGKTVTWNRFEIKQIRNGFDNLSVIQESSLIEKTLVIDECSTKIKFHEEAAIVHLIAFILNSGMTSSTEIFSLICGTKKIDINSDKLLRLKDISFNIIWSRTIQQVSIPCYSEVITVEPELLRDDVISSLNIFRDRLDRINNSPLLSKTKLRKSELQLKLKMHSISKIKFVLPTRIDILVEIESSKSILELLTMICQRLSIDINLLVFTLPPKKLTKSDENRIIAFTDLYPRGTIIINERS